MFNPLTPQTVTSSMSESKTLPNVEGKTLEFTIDIQDAQFNHEGWYYLVISLHNSFTRDFSQVQVKKSDLGHWETRREIQTDFTKQEENSPLSFFKDKKILFKMPKGFCKNDKNHDVYLLVEAFTADSTSGKGRKVGEGKFAIYPRQNAPRMNLYTEPGENYYKYTGVMSLLRTHSTDNIQMHCGRIRSTYSLRELPPPKPKTPPTPPPIKVPQRRPSPMPTPSPQPPLTPSPRDRPTPTVKREPAPQPPPTASSWGENLSLDFNLPKSPPLPPAADGKKIPEPPLSDSDRHTYSTDKTYRHVADGGQEQIEVIVHGASSLPLNPHGKVPQPYAVVKTKTAEDANKKSGVATHASVRPTHAPSWEEKVVLNIDEKTSQDETLVVVVGDAQTQKALVNYRVPVAYLTPFHQYHMELNMPAKGIPNGVKAYTTITRKLPALTKDPSCPNYLALEVLLMNVQRPIQSPMGPLIAVARIVPDYYNYKSDNLLSHPRNAGVTMQNVTFPSSHPSNFVVTERSQHGHPQLSLPGRPDEQPKWNHPYLFVERRDKATLFTPGAALVIEYYVATMAMSDQFWRMQSPIAFSAILMDEEMYKQLSAGRAHNGLRVDGVPMQGSDMSTSEGRRPTVGVILRLITTETPDSMVSVSSYEDVPTLDMFPPSEVPGYYRNDSPDILRVESSQPPVDTKMPPPAPHVPESPLSPARTPKTPPQNPYVIHNPDTYKTRQPNKGSYVLQKVKNRPLSPIKDGEMPPITAMETVLPDYQYIFQPGDNPQGRRTPERAAPAPGTSYEPDEMDKNSLILIDHQSKELGNYRGAVHKMGTDILALRNQVRDLDNLNSTLRRDLANYNDASRLMLDSSELDGLTKPEVLSRYAAIKQTLSSQTMEMKNYKDKLQRAQNELIKKNDQEKNYLKMQKAHASQQIMIQKLQDKLKKMRQLEEACKKQEDVIRKMELVLERHHKDRSKYHKDKASQDANEVLLQENKRLRAEIEDLRDVSNPVSSSRKVRINDPNDAQIRVGGGGSGDDELERMRLYQALEKAEGRIQSLEQHLANNSRVWGKERADMSLKLNEAEHGFGRSAGMVLHDYPVYNEFGTGKSSMKKLSPLLR